MKILNSTVLVTGANRGIGLSLVESLLKKGAAKVYATYRSDSDRSVFGQFGEKVIPLHLDLGDQDSITGLSESISSLDILINNAGIFTGTNLLDDTGDSAS